MIVAALDHVGVAVDDFDTAEVRWRTLLGGRRLAGYEADEFHARQYLYRNGAKLELLRAPPQATGFLDDFVRRHGAAVHHITLKVADYPSAVREVRAAGHDVVAEAAVANHWLEGFLRPTEVGGVVVQLASSALREDEWRAVNRLPDPDPPPPGAELLGLDLAHPDPDEACRLWQVLGARADESEDGLVLRWPDSVLALRLREGSPAGPGALVFSGARDLPATEGIGPGVRGLATRAVRGTS